MDFELVFVLFELTGVLAVAAMAMWAIMIPDIVRGLIRLEGRLFNWLERRYTNHLSWYRTNHYSERKEESRC